MLQGFQLMPLGTLRRVFGLDAWKERGVQVALSQNLPLRTLVVRLHKDEKLAFVAKFVVQRYGISYCGYADENTNFYLSDLKFEELIEKIEKRFTINLNHHFADPAVPKVEHASTPELASH